MKEVMHNHHEDWKTWDFNQLMLAYADLEKDEISSGQVANWLARWTETAACCDELYNRLYVATTVNTADKEAQKRFEGFMENNFSVWQSAEQKLKEKLLASGLDIDGMQIPLRGMRAEADLFREENLALFVQEEKINTAHDQVMGAQSVHWQGEERTVRQMEVVLREPEREVRRAGWELMADRQLQDREAINGQWLEYLHLRLEIARNAGFDDFRAYRWQQMKRFDYTPDDCKKFHDAIEQVAVPACMRLAERRKRKLGIDKLRYYDLLVDLSGQPQLKPFRDVRELIDKAEAIFTNVHPSFGEYFHIMNREGLLDLENRKNKAAGGYCTDFSHAKRPFIFANAVGIHDDVQTLMHEGGHAFHAFESYKLPYFQQRSEASLPMEFAEVASMAMEYLTSIYLDRDHSGYYSAADAARARVDHLEGGLLFWPYMAVVDAFQHWVYENPEESKHTDRCDAKWAALEARFRPFIDWEGYEDAGMTGWQRKDHIHQSPFYYVEYGLALLGAAQVWRNSLSDQARAVAQYRSALALGGTAGLPDLYKTAGARLAFDASTLGDAVQLMETTILDLEAGY